MAARRVNTVDFDLGDLTLGEIDEIEERTGMSIDEFQDFTNPEKAKGRPKGKMLRAMALVVLRREDPSVTWEDTADVVLDVTAAGDVPPTDASG